MPVQIVTRKKIDTSRIPDTLQFGTSVLASLAQRLLLDRASSWLPLSRRNGHGTAGLFAFAVVFLLSGPAWGIRPFALQFNTALRRLVAPIANLRALPTAASLSRALGKLTHPAVRSFLDHLFASDMGGRRLLSSPHVQHRDTHGQGWHVLDMDPTLEAFRQRPLPDDPSLPPATRIAPGTPGHTGHKRGEVRIRHVPVQHAGAGIWLAYRLDATRNSLLPLIADVVRTACKLLPKDATNVVLRADGEFGSVGALRTIVAQGVAVLARSSRYSLLDRDEAVARMPQLIWKNVASSGGGPPRQAADLGLFTLFPDEDAAGSEGGPVETRVIVTRFERSSRPDHGVLRDGFQIELFATTLPADAWPAESVAALYFGRSAIENRFAQEDREFGIDRTFSYHPPGQEWMSGIALFLWNVLIDIGVTVDPIPKQTRPQATHPIVVEVATEDVAVVPEIGGTEPEVSVTEERIVVIEPVNQTEEPVFLQTTKQNEVTPPTEPLEEERSLQAKLWGITRVVFNPLALPPGWRQDDEKMEIRCSNEKRLFVFRTECYTSPGRRKARNRLWIRTQAGACDGCPMRKECRMTGKSNAPKNLGRDLAPALREEAAELLEKLRSLRNPSKTRKQIREPRTQKPAVVTAAVPLPALSPLLVSTVGRFIPDSPVFMPAHYRQTAKRLLGSLTLQVVVTQPGTKRRRHRLLTATPADRQHRRRAWTERAENWRSGKVTLILGGPRAKFVLRYLMSSKSDAFQGVI